MLLLFSHKPYLSELPWDAVQAADDLPATVGCPRPIWHDPPLESCSRLRRYYIYNYIILYNFIIIFIYIIYSNIERHKISWNRTHNSFATILHTPMAFLRIEIVGSYTSARPCLYVTHHRASQQIHPCRPGSPQVDPAGLGTINESTPFNAYDYELRCALKTWMLGYLYHKHFDSPVQKVQKAEEKKRKVPELCRAMPSYAELSLGRV